MDEWSWKEGRMDGQTDRQTALYQEAPPTHSGSLETIPADREMMPSLTVTAGAPVFSTLASSSSSIRPTKTGVAWGRTWRPSFQHVLQTLHMFCTSLFRFQQSVNADDCHRPAYGSRRIQYFPSAGAPPNCLYQQTSHAETYCAICKNLK